MIQPVLPPMPKQTIYVLDRKCVCGERFSQQITMRYGKVLIFPLTIVWFYGQRQEYMQESLIYACYKCEQDHVAVKPDDISPTVWEVHYIIRCKELGIPLKHDSSTVWPYLTKEQALQAAGTLLEPQATHTILDNNGNVAARAYTIGQHTQDICIHVETEEYDWKG